MKTKPYPKLGPCTFSKQELLMIRAVGEDLFRVAISQFEHSAVISPPRFLELVAVRCFLDKRPEDKATASLRRCLKAIQGDEIFRNTPRYEALIKL